MHEDAKTNYDWRQDLRLIGCLSGAAFLAWASAVDHDEGFYTFLRIYVSATAAALAWGAWKAKQPIPLVAAGILAILFNPVLLVELERGEWIPIDAIVAVGLAWVGLEGPSKHLGRPILRLVPLFAAGALWAAANFEAFAPDGDQNTMNVDETMSAENVVSADDAAWLNEADNEVVGDQPTHEVPKMSAPATRTTQPSPDLDAIFSAPPATAEQSSELRDSSNTETANELSQGEENQSQD